MRDLNIGFLPICENDKLVGTVTDRDITTKSVAQGRDPRLAPVSEIMRPEVFYCYDSEYNHDGAVSCRRIARITRRRGLANRSIEDETRSTYGDA